jgi:hypothetical protein
MWGGEDMVVLLIIAVIAVAIYAYAAAGYYYAFKNWRPMCGCKGSVCDISKSAHNERVEPAET